MQALGAQHQQQFGLVQVQGLVVLAGIGVEPGHAVFQQRVALAQAEHRIAQHPVGGGRVLQQPPLRAQVGAQGVQAFAQCIDLVGLVLDQRPGLLLAHLPGVPGQPGGHAQGQHQRGGCKHAPARTAGGGGRNVCHV